MSASAASSSSASKAAHIAVKLKRKRTTTEYDGPVLARFTHGPPPHLGNPDLADDISFKLYGNPDERKNFQRILVAETPRVTYAAQNFGSQQSFRSNANQYAIGIFDSHKNKVKIVSCNHIYRMDQHVSALDGLGGSKEEDEEEAINFQTKQRVLADTFGSKKTQKRLASRAANQVTVQESTSQVLTHAVSHIQPNEEMETEEDLLEEIRLQMLPKFNESAENVREIYLVDSVAPSAVLDAFGPVLKKWRSVVKKGVAAVKKDAKSDEPLTTSAFVLNRLEGIASMDDDREQVLKLLIYLNLLLQFRAGGKNKKKFVQELKEEQVPAENIKAQLLSDFTALKTVENNPRLVFDASCEQKLLCYIAVTSLLLTNFTMDAEQIEAMAQDLKMMSTDMLKYYAEVGCAVSKSRIHLSAPLRLPRLRKKIERK